MSLFSALNIFLLPISVMVFIILDFDKHICIDKVQKKLALSLFVSILFVIIMEFLNKSLDGMHGSFVHVVLCATKTLYFVLQLISASYLLLFLDYNANRKKSRTQAWTKVLLAIVLFDVFLLILNFGGKFLFYYLDDNVYQNGELLWLRLILSFSPIVLLMFDYLIDNKKVTISQYAIVAFVAILAGFGTICDLLVKESMILWPCVVIAMLYTYLSMLRANYHLDALTHVENRHSLDNYLLELNTEKRDKTYGFIMIDLDKFKQINDIYGHAVGDDALRDSSNILRATISPMDFLARYGGDEFVIIAQNCRNIQPLVGKINRNLQKFNDKHIRPYTIEMSIGGDVFLPSDTLKPAEFLHKVDEYMFQIKKERSAKNKSTR